MQMRQAAVRNKRERILKHGVRLGRKTRDQIGAKHDFWPQPAQLGAEAHGIGAAMAPLHAL